MNPITPITNASELTNSEIETLKFRVHCLSQELWGCTDYPKRLNLLILLNAATADLLLLETNRQSRNRGCE
jgi:hypothetical protein